MIRRGEIYLCQFGAPDKQRPAVVITNDGAIAHLTNVTVAPITSTVRGVPSEVFLDVADGLKGPCAVNLHNLHTVPQSRLVRRVGMLNEGRVKALCTAMKLALGC